jgi:hypothetical protein
VGIQIEINSKIAGMTGGKRLRKCKALCARHLVPNYQNETKCAGGN